MAAERVDGELAAAVEEAVLGDVLADLPEAQPDRALTSATDISGLYVRHRNGLAAHARRFLRDSRDVDEVVQETFLRLFLAIGEIETELQAIAFARRTLTNLCIDRYRADRRRPTLVNLEAAPLSDLAEDWNADDPVLRAEDAAIVREALARLSPLHRAALVKREIEEKPLPQIAAELDIPEESVKHLLFRARRALRRLLVGTSVEPGVDLTASEVAALANRRAGAALMRGANVFIVLVVGAVVAAVGVRALEGRTQQPTVPAEALGGGGLPAAGTTRSTGSVAEPHHAGSGTHHVHPHHAVPLHLLPASPPVATRPRPTVAPVQHAPAAGGHKPTERGKPTNQTNGTFAASRSHFRLSGPLEVRGTPQVAATAPVTGSGGQTTASSSFTAPTSQGTFQLVQTVSTSNVTGDAVSMTPSFVVGDAVETPATTGSTASVQTAPNGTVTVDAVTGTQQDPTTNTFPLTSVTVHLVLAPDLSHVLSEAVVLTAAALAAPSAGTATAGATCTQSAGTTQQPAGTLTTGNCPSPGSVASAGGGNGSDTSSGQTPGTGVATEPGMLEISGMSGDDRQAVRSFTTSGGASS